jgi:hypothetical protein
MWFVWCQGDPNSYAYFIVYKVTLLSCPSIINKCLLVKETQLQIDFLKKNKSSLNKKKIIQALFCIATQLILLFVEFDVILL